ncbi:GNAT family N-acetyltransferase [Capsulimonas corticalis]|nr:GNAT family N-acetyltransferase [Capsulimonas corticalis]
MAYLVRPLEDQDYASIARIVNLIEAPWQTNEQEARQEDAEIERSQGMLRHFVAVEAETQEVVGHAVLRGGRPASRRQEYHLELRVAPDASSRGVGTQLWVRIADELSQLPDTSVRAWIRDCYPHALAFARARGFDEISRSGPWRREISTADRASLQHLSENAAGIAITTFAKESEANPDLLRELHSLRIAVDADIPSTEPYAPLSFESFVQEIEGDSALKDAFFIAKHNAQYVGLTCLHRNAIDPQALDQSITSVMREFRRHGIGAVLKTHGIDYAAANGYKRIVTYVDSTNAPMAALNRRMGFQPGIAGILMERTP